MAIRHTVNIYNSEGYENERVVSEHATATYEATHLSHVTLDSSTNKVEVKMWPVTTAKMVYMDSGDKAVSLYKNNSAESWTFTGHILITGVSWTALHIQAENGAELDIFIAGDA